MSLFAIRTPLGYFRIQAPYYCVEASDFTYNLQDARVFKGPKHAKNCVTRARRVIPRRPYENVYTPVFQQQQEFLAALDAAEIVEVELGVKQKAVSSKGEGTRLLTL
jgi:hypothetical protein